jgi:hypothetical protein
VPPPLYATQVPAPLQLRYRAQAGSRGGWAELRWQPAVTDPLLADEGLQPPGAADPAADAPAGRPRYRMQLAVRGTDGTPWLELDSRGLLDATGVAPRRLLERRAGRAWRAVHWRPELAAISFSGPRHALPAWPGTQDRLSWIAQLAAVLQAAPLPPPRVELRVVDARGAAATWRLTAVEAADPQAAAASTVPGTSVWHAWRHEPEGPDDLRVQVWTDPALGHWPQRLRYSTLRGVEVLDLRLEPLLGR